MDIGPIPSLSSAAGAPLAQTQGPEADRAQAEAAVQNRAAQYNTKAARAAGIGQTDGESHTTEERYGDGRLPWDTANNNAPAIDTEKTADVLPAPREPSSPNGRLIDLSG